MTHATRMPENECFSSIFEICTRPREQCNFINKNFIVAGTHSSNRVTALLLRFDSNGSDTMIGCRFFFLKENTNLFGFIVHLFFSQILNKFGSS